MRNNLSQEISNNRRNNKAAGAALRGLVVALVALAVTGIASAQNNGT